VEYFPVDKARVIYTKGLHSYKNEHARYGVRVIYKSKEMSKKFGVRVIYRKIRYLVLHNKPKAAVLAGAFMLMGRP
jgi:hypothetical protein